MQSIFSRLCVSIAFLSLSFSLGHSELLLPNPPKASVQQAVIEALPPQTRGDLGPGPKQTRPVFVFVPGILGSKLSRIENGHAEPFWGTTRAFLWDDPSFRYNPTDTVSAEILDELYVREIDKSFDVYGGAYKEIKAITGAPDSVLRFPYDWRQSNVLSAADFSKWLCRSDNQATIKDRPIVFIAHSMGGLVLKYWLKHHYQISHCDGAEPFGKYMKIVKIIYLGTPNFGAPKAILTFSQGESLYFDKPNDESIWRFWAKLLHWADVNIISSNLNRYGIRYPSAYQLLPIYGRTAQKCSLSGLHENDLEFQSPNDFPANYDLFDAAVWKELGWPKQLSGKERDDFLANELPNLLSQAFDFLCGVATSDVDSGFDVTYFYGVGQQTVCGLRFDGQSNEGIPKYCRGDGTVPDWIAAKDRGGDFRADSQVHMQQVSALEFYDYLENNIVRKQFGKLASDAAQNEKQLGATVDYLARLRFVPTATPTDSAEDRARIRKVADLVTEKLNIKPAEIYKDSTANKSVASRANQMLVYANLTAAEPRQRAWAYNNAANIYLAKCDFRQSVGLAQRALDEADKVQLSNPQLSTEMRDLRAKSAWFAAISSGHLGNSNEAKNYKALAIANGSRLAAARSVPTLKTSCIPNTKTLRPAVARRN
jgi:pimeloyl-ACP methyl ester carboxylesterase